MQKEFKKLSRCLKKSIFSMLNKEFDLFAHFILKFYQFLIVCQFGAFLRYFEEILRNLSNTPVCRAFSVKVLLLD